MRSQQIFCILEKYLCANFQLKRSNNEWGVAILSVFFVEIMVKTLYFYHNFNKKYLKIATPHSLFDRFSWKFAQRYFSRMQKICWERIFEFFLFLLFIARQSSKNSENRHFGGVLGYK